MSESPYWLVTIPRGSHPIPFRIRSLSPSGPMVVIPQGIVRVGRCQPLFSPIAQTMGENKVAPKPHRNLSMLRRRRTKKNLTAARKELPFLFVRARVPARMGFAPAYRFPRRGNRYSTKCLARLYALSEGDTMPARHFDVSLIPSAAYEACRCRFCGYRRRK